ncbi:hypothetical protein BBK36DRAFT_1203920 [Trichoderma citrinoviride]|uniref:Zn(2)-C6 fungal-type domain-containing protein n=1 Tax=Trichoderma citrinoviride TaxID=58853 RepID=A0A2T4B6S4_9HYPO|nr:hypothetical protein BBK36DRAFT_1203920 [Trichoderma citrinoviride]PTB65025.1 hypothetical protein BBK36DRAFT_1203920 [Trichoderma citrinoviride]
MNNPVTSNDIMAVRKRKTHRKSRLGCGNCKIRSIKCDESKPSCRRCHASGFTCNYSRTIPALQLSHANVFSLSLDLGHTKPHTVQADSYATDSMLKESFLQPGLQIPIVLPLQGKMGTYTLRPQDYAALSRFQTRTGETLGNAASRKCYSKVMASLAKEHPFLYHFFLLLSLLHDVHLSPTPPSASHQSSLAFHWYHGTALLSHFLSLPSPSTTLSSSHRDALWISAAILGAASFASIRTQDPYAAWPLADPDPASDLDWLKMGHGKRAVWSITDPTRPESVFHNILDNTPMQRNHFATSAPIPPDALPKAFYTVFNLSSSPEDILGNPYHSPCSILATIWNIRINDDNVIFFLSFITQIDPRYRSLVEEKDPRALLLLLYWHSIVMHHDKWWLRRRCDVEARAILIYVERNCADDEDIMELLEVPRARLERGIVKEHDGSKLE